MTTEPEKAKRLTPKGDTLRELFLKSGNLCAFPGCGQLMMDADGTFIGQVCHIEAAEDDGERFNKNITNEARRHISNLMLMCYPHHQKTNDVKIYTVAKLKTIKADHEKRFSHRCVVVCHFEQQMPLAVEARPFEGACVELIRISRQARNRLAGKLLVGNDWKYHAGSLSCTAWHG